MRLKRRWLIGLASVAIACAAYAQPPGASGLVWLDNEYEFDLNSALLVASGAISTTIAIPDQPPRCLSKDPNTLNIRLDLSALTGLPGLPTITLTGADIGPGAGVGGRTINWSTGPVEINLCLRRSDYPDLPADILIKRLLGANLRVNAEIIPAYYSSACNRNFFVKMTPVGGNQFNYVEVEAYAFCVESSFTRIVGRVQDANYIAYSGPVPEPASWLVLAAGVAGLCGKHRRRFR